MMRKYSGARFLEDTDLSFSEKPDAERSDAEDVMVVEGGPWVKKQDFEI